MFKLLLLISLSVFISSSQQSALPRVESVSLEVYYESQCPDSKKFFREQLSATYPVLGDVMDIDLFPYGKANDTCSIDGCCTFTCQHGPEECEGNKMLACAKNFYDKDSNIRFNICVMSKINPPTAGEQCAAELGLSFTEVLECSLSCVGDEFLHDIGVATHALDNPALDYVPWMISNGVHTDEIQSQAEYNLTSFVCSEYQGTEPTACSPTKT